RSDGIADAQPRQAMDLGECAQDDDVLPFADKSQRVGRAIEKLEISFIENNDYSVGHARHELIDGLLRNQCAGRIVWVWHKNNPRPRRDAGGHFLQAPAILRGGHYDGARAERGGDQFVNHKIILGHQHLLAGLEKRVSDELKQFVRAVADDEILRAKTKFRSKRVAQAKTLALG